MQARSTAGAWAAFVSELRRLLREDAPTNVSRRAQL